MRISVDVSIQSFNLGRIGPCKDNIWIERFWRTIKQGWIYVYIADTVDELRSGIDSFIRFYNYKRPHQSIDELLPSMRYGITA